MDAIGSERHFIDHLAPTWKALPSRLRGQFRVPPELMEHARSLGIEPTMTAFTIGTDAYAKPPPQGPRALVAAYGDVKKARRLGYGDFARFEHGMGQSYGTSHPSYPGGLDHGDVSLFLMPNEYSAHRWQTVYPDATVKIVGSPRLDALPAKEPGPLTAAISFHWLCMVVPETMSAISYYQNVLPELAHAFNVIGHGHPRILDMMRAQCRRAGIELVEDFAEVCRRADIYVCDNSSTLYEFASTGRPVVVLNAPHFRREIQHGLRFWEDADVGMQVDRPEDLIPIVKAALSDPAAQQAARERAVAHVYAYRFGAAQRAAHALAAWDAQNLHSVPILQPSA